MRIYLVGYMGCGKTTLGRELAEVLGLNFIDLDKFIEAKHFKTISQIFEEHGEDDFRKKEHECLKEVSEYEDIVVATGGGVPCFFDNIDIMNRTGACIFLDISPEILVERLHKSGNERPLVKGKSKEELIGLVNDMLVNRRPSYLKARYIITNDNITTSDLLAQFMEAGNEQT
ncbi:MAG: shikimate kinase [Mangrovibacterium sp.]